MARRLFHSTVFMHRLDFEFKMFSKGNSRYDSLVNHKAQ